MTTTDPAYDAVIAKIADLIGKVRENWQKFLSGVDQLLKKVPSPLDIPIRGGVHKVTAKFTDVLKFIERTYLERGSAGDLRAAAEVWTQKAGQTAVQQAADLAKNNLDSDSDWSGPAADRYGEAILGQGVALNQLKTVSDGVVSTLNEIASAMLVFWVGFAAALATWLVALVACIAGVASAVLALPAMITYVGASVVCIGAVVGLQVNYQNTINEKKATLGKLAASMPATWPSAVAGKMGDASVKDGDPSDWRPK